MFTVSLLDTRKAVGTALWKAQEVIANPPYGVPASVRGAWRTAVDAVEKKHLPALIRDMPAAEKDLDKAKKWVNFAKAAASQLQFVVDDAQKQGIVSGIVSSLAGAVKTLVQKLIDTAEEIAKAAVAAVAVPILSSPLVWAGALGFGLYFFWPIILPQIKRAAGR
jgi:hypothetical protein